MDREYSKFSALSFTYIRNSYVFPLKCALNINSVEILSSILEATLKNVSTVRY